MPKPVLPLVQRGFTLFEVMIVMVIVALLAGAAAMVVGGHQEGRQLENEVRKLMARMSLAQEEAIFQNREIGLQLEPEGYDFRELDEARLQWSTLSQDYMQPVKFPDWVYQEIDGTPGEWEITGAEQKTVGFYPQILFFSSGESTPFKLILKHRAKTELTYIIQSDGLNGITLLEPDVE